MPPAQQQESSHVASIDFCWFRSSRFDPNWLRDRNVYLCRLSARADGEIYRNEGSGPRPFRDRGNFLAAHLIACSREAKELQSQSGFVEWVEEELEYHWQRYSPRRRLEELILCARPSIFRGLVVRREAQERQILELASEVAALKAVLALERRRRPGAGRGRGGRTRGTAPGAAFVAGSGRDFGHPPLGRFGRRPGFG